MTIATRSINLQDVPSDTRALLAQAPVNGTSIVNSLFTTHHNNAYRAERANVATPSDEAWRRAIELGNNYDAVSVSQAIVRLSPTLYVQVVPRLHANTDTTVPFRYIAQIIDTSNGYRTGRPCNLNFSPASQTEGHVPISAALVRANQIAIARGETVCTVSFDATTLDATYQNRFLGSNATTASGLNRNTLAIARITDGEIIVAAYQYTGTSATAPAVAVSINALTISVAGTLNVRDATMVANNLKAINYGSDINAPLVLLSCDLASAVATRFVLVTGHDTANYSSGVVITSFTATASAVTQTATTTITNVSYNNSLFCYDWSVASATSFEHIISVGGPSSTTVMINIRTFDLTGVYQNALSGTTRVYPQVHYVSSTVAYLVLQTGLVRLRKSGNSWVIAATISDTAPNYQRVCFVTNATQIWYRNTLGEWRAAVASTSVVSAAPVFVQFGDQAAATHQRIAWSERYKALIVLYGCVLYFFNEDHTVLYQTVHLASLSGDMFPSGFLELNDGTFVVVSTYRPGGTSATRLYAQTYVFSHTRYGDTLNATAQRSGTIATTNSVHYTLIHLNVGYNSTLFTMVFAATPRNAATTQDVINFASVNAPDSASLAASGGAITVPGPATNNNGSASETTVRAALGQTTGAPFYYDAVRVFQTAVSVSSATQVMTVLLTNVALARTQRWLVTMSNAPTTVLQGEIAFTPGVAGYFGAFTYEAPWPAVEYHGDTLFLYIPYQQAEFYRRDATGVYVLERTLPYAVNGHVYDGVILPEANRNVVLLSRATDVTLELWDKAFLRRVVELNDTTSANTRRIDPTLDNGTYNVAHRLNTTRFLTPGALATKFSLDVERATTPNAYVPVVRDLTLSPESVFTLDRSPIHLGPSDRLWIRAVTYWQMSCTGMIIDRM